MKKTIVTALTGLLLLLAFPVGAFAQELIVGGQAVGIRIQTEGVLVSGVAEVETAQGPCTPAADAGLPIYEYEPRRVKMAGCGNGLAEKEQVQRMVKTLLGLQELPQNDAADALAIAITHAHSNSLLSTNVPI